EARRAARARCGGAVAGANADADADADAGAVAVVAVVAQGNSERPVPASNRRAREHAGGEGRVRAEGECPPSPRETQVSAEVPDEHTAAAPSEGPLRRAQWVSRGGGRVCCADAAVRGGPAARV